MKVHCTYDELKLISELKPHPDNANIHPADQIERLAKILDYQGFRYPIKVSKRSGFVTSGHGRIEAAKLNGWLAVPVNYQDYESEDQEIADLHADNAIASWAEFSLAKVNVTVQKLSPDFNIEFLGLKDFEIEFADKFDEETEDDIHEKVEPKTKLGDLYILGNHRLLCGDSTSIDAVDKLMDGQKADMVFTDPPYGISFDDASNTSKQIAHTGKISAKFGKIIGDDEEFDPGLILGYFDYCQRIFLWGANEYTKLLPRGSWIVWDKKLEQQADVPYGDFELCWSRNVGWKMLRHVWGGFKNKERSEKERYHPTQKPIALAEDFFQRWGKIGDRVTDLFGGSGTTLIACEKTNRKCFMMELDPHYCDVIVARWEKYTGKQAVLECEEGSNNGNET